MLFVLGLDGATLDLIAPWCDAGHLPNLAELRQRGVTSPLESTLPPITAAAWASFMTGKNPAGHGVFDFFRGRAGKYSLVNSTHIDGPMLWEQLSAAGLSCGVLNVPVTHPPRPIDGYLVPGLLSPNQGTTTHPLGLLDAYRAELGPYRLTPDLLYRPGHEAAFIAELRAVTETQIRYALRLLRDRPTDFFMVHFLAGDIAQHALWKHMDARHPWHDAALDRRFGDAILGIFQLIDTALGDMLTLLPDTADVIVMSDHGFGPVQYTVNLNNWFITQGLMKLKQTRSVRMRHWLRSGLWRSRMATRFARLFGRDRLLDFEDVDWSQTAAYAMGHIGQVYLNLRGREPHGIVAPDNYETMRRQVIEALRRLPHPDTGQPFVTGIVAAEEAGAGPHRQDGPDLFVELDHERAVAYPMFAADGQIVSEQRHGNSGDHRRAGLLIMAGPHIIPGAVLNNPRIIDLAPTILRLMDAPAIETDGRVLTEALNLVGSAPKPGKAEAEGGAGVVELSPSEQATVEAQLRKLGYLG
ncbi:MAG: alkaline phosphatase family protein [Caldilineales bacterium]|nr:alkaline phosphatase family protein [Caldilineales bacterium]